MAKPYRETNRDFNTKDYGGRSGFLKWLSDYIIRETSVYTILCDLDSHVREYECVSKRKGAQKDEKAVRQMLKTLFDTYRGRGMDELNKALDGLSEEQLVSAAREAIKDKRRLMQKIVR